MSDIQLIVNTHVLPGCQSAINHEGVDYGSLRDIFTVLGANIGWQERERQAIVKWSSHLLLVPAGNSTLTLNGDKKVLDHPNLNINQRLYVPLSSFAAALGGTLRTESDTRLHLFLPAARLEGIKIDGNSVYFNFSNSGLVESRVEGDTMHVLLKDTSWPQALRQLRIEREADGSLRAEIVAAGDSLDRNITERGVRFSWKESRGKLAGVICAVDAGHGGSDPGAVGPTGLQEKDVALAISKALTALLKSEGAQVIETRPKDDRVTLEERVKLSRQGGANVYISIHLNGFSRPEANGTETFCSTNNEQGEELARILQGELLNKLGLRDRGMKRAEFYVLRTQADIPSVLLEIAFITNQQEEELLALPSFQQRSAEAVFIGLCQYVQNHKAFRVD